MSNFNENLDAMLTKLENFISSKTVVGEPIVINNITIIPLVDVSFGLGLGNTEKRANKDGKNSGGGGLGAKMSPNSIMVINNGHVQLISVNDKSSINKVIDMVPGIVNKLMPSDSDTVDVEIEE